MAEKKCERIDLSRFSCWIFLECFAVLFLRRMYYWPTTLEWHEAIPEFAIVAACQALIVTAVVGTTAVICSHPSDFPPSPRGLDEP